MSAQASKPGRSHRDHPAGADARSSPLPSAPRRAAGGHAGGLRCRCNGGRDQGIGASRSGHRVCEFRRVHERGAGRRDLHDQCPASSAGTPVQEASLGNLALGGRLLRLDARARLHERQRKRRHRRGRRRRPGGDRAALCLRARHEARTDPGALDRCHRNAPAGRRGGGGDRRTGVSAQLGGRCVGRRRGSDLHDGLQDQGRDRLPARRRRPRPGAHFVPGFRLRQGSGDDPSTDGDDAVCGPDRRACRTGAPARNPGVGRDPDVESAVGRRRHEHERHGVPAGVGGGGWDGGAGGFPGRESTRRGNRGRSA